MCTFNSDEKYNENIKKETLVDPGLSRVEHRG